MKRTQVQLTEKQYELLKKISLKKNISMAEIVREAISIYSSSSAIITRDTLIKDASGIIGKYSSGKKDVSIKHDDYLRKAFKGENNLNK
jgi:hypothetical protein